MPPKKFPAIAFISLLLGGIAIGFAAIFMRLSDVNPLASAFWRMALAAPVLWCWVFMVRRQERIDDKRTDFSRVLLLSGLFFAADLGTWHMSLHYTTVSNATLLSNFAPVLIALWMWRVHKMRFTRIFLVGILIALAGAIMLVGPNASHGSGKLLGDGLGLMSAVFYTGYMLAIKDACDQYATARLLAWSTSITAAVLLPCALGMPGPFWPSSSAGWVTLVSLALVAQIGGQTLITYAFAHLPATLSSVSLLIQPLTATIAAWVIFHETISPLQMAGGALLLCGIYLSKRGS
ncbi:DMT family transporter [Herminiimonas sp. CN]|uniref:DMT family transporter n=1 Tax=Herminiimonas sp. CN TaxID=1349818 RepID=UPI0004739CC7|nr:DMT family transporter [Herminiimonas sp. CN]